jgi:hypothetical protein
MATLQGDVRPFDTAPVWPLASTANAGGLIEPCRFNAVMKTVALGLHTLFHFPFSGQPTKLSNKGSTLAARARSESPGAVSAGA